MLKSELKKKKPYLFEYPPGPFYKVPKESLHHMSSTMYDEEEDMEIRVRYICSCDEYVYEMGVDGSFACIHCDSACYQSNCATCADLHAKDLWENDANI